MRTALAAMLDARDRVIAVAPGQIERPGAGLAPDVVIYDLDDDDLERAHELAAVAPAIAILDDYRGTAGTAALRAGARAVLPRNPDAEELQAAVAAVTLGYAVVPPEVARAATGDAGDDAPALTERERQVLTLLARGLANKTIAARLGISEHTVKFHVGSILSKLGAASRTEAVTTGVRLGLIMI